MAKTELNFGKELAELEAIVAWFESGEVDLDAALPKFERGMELVVRMRDHLAQVQNKVEIIKQKFPASGKALEPDQTPRLGI